MPLQKRSCKSRTLSAANTSVKRGRSSSDSEYPCDYLQMVLSKRKMRCICDALDIHYEPSTSKADLCMLIEINRPDLMRSWKWNVLRACFREFDIYNLAPIKNLITLPFGIYGVYGALELVTYIMNNPNYAVGHGLFALQRQEARKLMGYDSRKRTKKSYEAEKKVFLKMKQQQNITSLYSQLNTREISLLKKCLSKYNVLERLTVEEQHAICLTMDEVDFIKKYYDTFAEVVAPDEYNNLSRFDFQSQVSFYAVPKNDVLARSGKGGRVWFHARPLLKLYHKKGWLNTSSVKTRSVRKS